jgi:plastocyanin
MYSKKKVSSPKSKFLKINGLLLIALLTAITLPGCGSTDSEDYGDETPAPNEVWMENQAFYPETRTVTEGTTVTWVNKSSEIHTATSGSNGEHNGIFDSGDISPNGEYSYTFTETGTYNYFCIPHQPHMTGTIIVLEEGSDTGNDY